jgi:hypothetical protein
VDIRSTNLFWGNVVIGCCLCNRLSGNLLGCSIIIFLTSWVVVETQKHAHSLIGQNPCWHCETQRDRDPDMSAWLKSNSDHGRGQETLNKLEKCTIMFIFLFITMGISTQK